MTDDQIRILRGVACRVDSGASHDCSIALGDVPLVACSNTHPKHDCVPSQRRSARRRCVDAWIRIFGSAP